MQDKNDQVNPDDVEVDELFKALSQYDVERRKLAKIEKHNLKIEKSRKNRKKAKKHRKKFK